MLLEVINALALIHHANPWVRSCIWFLMQCNSDEEPKNHYFCNTRESVITIDSWSLKMTFWCQASFEAVQSSIVISWALYTQSQHITLVSVGNSTRVQHLL